MSRLCLVTGGAKGIGSAITRTLYKEGYDIAIIYHNSEDSAMALSSELNFSSNRAIPYKCDVSSGKNIEKTVKDIVGNMGSPSFLVNNAGISQQRLFTDITDDDWDKIVGVDMTAVFKFCRCVLPYMVHEKFGSIVNISSMWGQTGGSCEVHYSSAKAGVIGLTKALAKEVAPSGIRVNCVAPGCIDTAMMSNFSESEIASICEEIPMLRMGTPIEVAECVSFLLSGKASYITGQVIGVNGGLVV